MTNKFRLLHLLLIISFFPLYAEATIVRGTVVDMTGAPIPLASVGFYSTDGDWEIHADSAGKFNIELPPGTYEIEVKSTGFTPQLIRDFKVERTDLAPMTIKLQVGSCPPCCGSSPSCSIADVSYTESSGKSALKGQLFLACEKSVFAGATVRLYKMWMSESSATSRTDDHGDFLFADIDPGGYELQFSSKGYSDMLTFNVRVKNHKIAIVSEEFGLPWQVSCSPVDGSISKPKSQ
jgi:hypothetical protein